jgi:hypothetical protein
VPPTSLQAVGVARRVLLWLVVAEQGKDRDKKDRIDVLVYTLWVAVLLVLLRYI